jgi:hypothetical protein
MKKSFITNAVILIFLSMGLVGCSSLFSKNEGVVGKSMKAEDTAQKRVEAVDQSIVLNDKQKLQTIGVFAAGTEYALSKVAEPTKEVEVARELNARVITLSETPALEHLKSMHTMVDDLVSQLQERKDSGLAELTKRDTQIYSIQLEKKALEIAKEHEIKKYMDVAQVAAGKADQYASTLGDMDSMWGLGAIFYGVKRLVIRSALFIGIFGLIYLILRIASTANPAAAAIFSIFDIGVSFVMKLLKGLAPGAAKLANLMPEAVTTLYKETLGHIVDTFELLKTRDKEAIAKGEPLRKYTILEILNEFGGAMDQSHKDLIKEVKVDMNWKS